MKKTKCHSFVISLVVCVYVFGSVTAFAADIPVYYSSFIGSETCAKWGFEFTSAALRLQKGETYWMSDKLPDGTQIRYYYVSDGTGAMRLSNPYGEVITRDELENYFTAKPTEKPITSEAAAVIQTTAYKPTVASVSSGIPKKDLVIWNDADYEITEYELEVIRLLNVEREKAGLKPVTINTELCKVERIKATEMAELDYFTHKSPNYGSPMTMVKTFGITCKWTGENASCRRSPEAVVKGWMNSQEHKKIMLDSTYTQAGIGYANRNDINPSATWTNYWCLLLMN